MVVSSARFFRIDFGCFGFEAEAMAMADVNDARELLVLFSSGAFVVGGACCEIKYVMYIPRRKKTKFEDGKYQRRDGYRSMEMVFSVYARGGHMAFIHSRLTPATAPQRHSHRYIGT